MQRREPTVDWARGVASVLMIQGHAWHGWIAPAIKHEAPYQFTRLFATLPLPAFMVLAGTAAAYRVRAAVERAEPARALRATLVRRGLQVTAAGYAVNLAYAWMDGAESYQTLVRADVLHAIGLSLAALGLCAGGRTAPPCPRAFARRVSLLGAAVMLACPWLSPAWPDPPVPLQPWVGLFIDVPGITVMPFVPLVSWTCTGALAGLWLSAASDWPQPQRLIGLGVVGFSLAWTGKLASDAWLTAAGGTLTRAHPAVLPSVVEYAGRGLVVLGLAPLLVASLPARLRAPFRDFGRASLWAYVFHIPFCYGALGVGLRGRLGMAEAAPWVLLLVVATYAVVRLRLKLASAPRAFTAQPSHTVQT